jgi:hypothetical protein
MAQIVLRSVKGQPLTITEADANFNNLNTEVGTKLTATDYNAADVLAKLLTVDGSGSGLDADLLDGKNSASTNTVSTIVARDQSGNFAANTITANLIGNVTGNVTGNFSGTLTGVADNVSGIVAIINGGTGATSVPAARTALGLGTISTQAANNVAITGGSITGITKLAIADGGTGSGTPAGARVNLGLNIGSDVQQYSSELNSLAGQTGTGLYARTAANTYAQRSIAVGTNGLSVSNADGVSGNPTLNIKTDAALTIGSLAVGNITSSGTLTTGAITASSLSVSGALSTSGTNVEITGSGASNALRIRNSSSGLVQFYDVTDPDSGIYTYSMVMDGGQFGFNFSTSSTAYDGGSRKVTFDYNGNINATGNITGYFSDDRLKTKLGKIENALDKLCSLEGFYFEANQTAQDLGYTAKKEVGVSAQSTQAVLPEVVHQAPIGHDYLTVDYARMMPLVIEAIKELRAEINALK